MSENVKVVKRVKKVNLKDKAKVEIMEIIQNALTENDIEFHDGLKYGMTNGTLIVSHKDTDIQIKPIVPKSGTERYPVVIYEDWKMGRLSCPIHKI